MRLAAKIGIVRHQVHFFLRAITLEDEWTGADRVGFQAVGAKLLRRLLTHDVAARIVGEAGVEECAGERLVERDCDDIRVGTGECHADVIARVRRGVLVRRLLQRIHNILARELVRGHPVGGVAHHAVTQNECPGLLPLRVRDRPRQRGGQVRFESGRVAGLVAQQAVEDHVDQGAILGAATVVWID